MPLSARQNDFTEETSFWIFIQQDGQDIGGVCAKYDSIGHEPIGDYWSRTLSRLFFPGGDGRVDYQDTEDAVKIGGQVVYVGDLFLVEDVRGASEQLAQLMRFLFVTCLVKWPKLDWIYGFVRSKDLKLSTLYGFTDIIPTTLEWSDSRNGRSNDEYIVAVSRPRLGLVLKLHGSLKRRG